MFPWAPQLLSTILATLGYLRKRISAFFVRLMEGDREGNNEVG